MKFCSPIFVFIFLFFFGVQGFTHTFFLTQEQISQTRVALVEYLSETDLLEEPSLKNIHFAFGGGPHAPVVYVWSDNTEDPVTLSIKLSPTRTRITGIILAPRLSESEDAPLPPGVASFAKYHMRREKEQHEIVLSDFFELLRFNSYDLVEPNCRVIQSY